MRLSFELNANTGRFAVLCDTETRHLLFETYHLTQNERLALSNAFRHVETKCYEEGLKKGSP